jgi:hypothetical protein
MAKKQKGPLVGYKPNFVTLQMAYKNGDLCMLDAREKATGKTVALVCAVNREGEEFAFVPIAVMIGGNPYELYDPPSPDGGYVVE